MASWLAFIVHDDALELAACTATRQIRPPVLQHREAKQLTGLQACQCRLARSQRNYIALALRTWTCLKRLAGQAKTTVYQLKQRLLDNYMRHELAQPTSRFA